MSCRCYRGIEAKIVTDDHILLIPALRAALLSPHRAVAVEEKIRRGGDVVYRLEDGIEHFFITGINNPAGSEQAQSTIPVSHDLFAYNFNAGANKVGRTPIRRYVRRTPPTNILLDAPALTGLAAMTWSVLPLENRLR